MTRFPIEACQGCGLPLPAHDTPERRANLLVQGWVSVIPADWLQGEYEPPTIICPVCVPYVVPHLQKRKEPT